MVIVARVVIHCKHDIVNARIVKRVGELDGCPPVSLKIHLAAEDEIAGSTARPVGGAAEGVLVGNGHINVKVAGSGIIRVIERDGVYITRLTDFRRRINLLRQGILVERICRKVIAATVAAADLHDWLYEGNPNVGTVILYVFSTRKRSEIVWVRIIVVAVGGENRTFFVGVVEMPGAVSRRVLVKGNHQVVRAVVLVWRVQRNGVPSLNERIVPLEYDIGRGDRLVVVGIVESTAGDVFHIDGDVVGLLFAALHLETDGGDRAARRHGNLIRSIDLFYEGVFPK